MDQNTLNEIYYQTTTLDADANNIDKVNKLCMFSLYLLWAMEASQTMVDRDSADTLSVFHVFAENFFDNMNEEVKAVTIQALRNLADSLEAREED